MNEQPEQQASREMVGAKCEKQRQTRTLRAADDAGLSPSGAGERRKKQSQLRCVRRDLIESLWYDVCAGGRGRRSDGTRRLVSRAVLLMKQSRRSSELFQEAARRGSHRLSDGRREGD